MAIGNRISRRLNSFDRFDQNAIDGDNDGLVQEQTRFERPATIRNRAVAGSISAEKRPKPGSQTADQAQAEVRGAESEHKLWARIANENDWVVLKSPGGHITYLSPDPTVPPLTFGATGGGGRGLANMEAELRRRGLPIPRKDTKPKASTAFRLEDSAPKLNEEKLQEAIRYAAATQKDVQKISIDEFAELLDIDEELKPELAKSINEKFPGYFPDENKKPETVSETRNLTRREKRRGISGSISSSEEGKKSIAPESLYKEAEAAGVSLDTILDDSDFDNDVEWSSNSWSIGKTKVQQAGDAVIVRNGKDGKPEVLMIRRKTAPFTDGYALPGGLLDDGETFEQTVDREMEEEVGIPASKANSRRYLGDLKAKDWDPRFVEGVHVGATRFDVPEGTEAIAGSDAKGAEWVSVEDLANGKHRIGFGHAAWLSMAFENDAELSRKFDILARASRHRNQEIIRRVNKKRKEAGAKLFTGLESPNKHYIPEGTGPLGVRKVNNLGFDLAKVITRNPGFFDKRTEEMFIYRATHSSADTAKKFSMTEREFDDKLREATQKLEDKIRKDIADSMKRNNRKQGLKGSISTRITGGNEVDRAVREMRLNDRQRATVRNQTKHMHEAFRTGEIYDMPIHAAIDSQRKELLDSIRITTAKGGLPMIVAKPHPLINPYLPIEREWATIELPEKEAVSRFMRELMQNQGENNEDLSGLDVFYSYFSNIIKKIEKDGGEVPVLEFSRNLYDTESGYTSYVQDYYLSLQDPVKATQLLESFDLGVHDLFGHYGTGRAYDRHGEWANYLAMQDFIEHANIGLTPQQKDGLHRFWLREYGTFQIVKRGDMLDMPIDKNDGWLRGHIIGYTGPAENLLKILDSGENGLGGTRISGSIGGRKIKDIPLSRLEQISVNDVENKLAIINRRKKSGSGLSGSMGLMDDDAEVGEYVDYLKDKMGPSAWAGEQGQEVRDIATRMFNLDISKEERDRLIDDLLDIEVQYTDYEPEDTFDYALDDLDESNKEWKEYLAHLQDTDPDEYDFWKNYNPNTGFNEEDDGYQPSLFDEPWDRPTPISPKGKNNSKRKIFGWRRNKDKPSRRITKIDFYGHDKLRSKQSEQLELFRNWKKNKDWKSLHNAHYDWWAFPIDRGSAAYGDGYNVAGKNIEELISDKKYMANLVELASIYSEAMGWDIVNREWLKDLDWDKGQDPRGQAYGARLYKIARSLQIFGLKDEYDSFSLMVESLRLEDDLRRRIGKSQYWDNPDVPFNDITPGTKRHARKMREQFGDVKPAKKKPGKKITGSMAAPPRSPRGNGRSNIAPPSQPRERFIRELNVDDWYIFTDDINEYFEKVKKRDIAVSTQDYRELMKAVSIFNSVEAVPTDDNGISVNMSDEQVRQLRIVLKKISNMDNEFFNIDDIYNALPTKERPKTIEAGGPDV